MQRLKRKFKCLENGIIRIPECIKTQKKAIWGVRRLYNLHEQKYYVEELVTLIY